MCTPCSTLKCRLAKDCNNGQCLKMTARTCGRGRDGLLARGHGRGGRREGGRGWAELVDEGAQGGGDRRGQHAKQRHKGTAAGA